jgi:FMNH2-dependent dimethyl sulfone monooxygenase
LVSAGGSPAGTQFAAANVDQLVILADSLDKVRASDARLEPLLRTSGHHVTTSPFSVALVRPGEGEADEEWTKLVDTVNAEAVKEIATDTLGNAESARVLFEEMGEREALLKFGAAGAQLKLVGTPESVAAQLIELHKTTRSRNALVAFPLWSPQELQTFTPVLKILRDAGVWQPPEQHNYSW